MTDDALRGLEQATVRRPDDPQAWAALAHAHARLGREEESMRAAVRALRLDPASEARDLLLPMSAARPGRPELINAVAWRGSRFGEVRTVEGAPPVDWRTGPMHDLGHGLVAYAAGGELVGIDVANARVAWRQPTSGRYLLLGSQLWLERTSDGLASIARVDHRTGTSVGPVIELDVPCVDRWSISGHRAVLLRHPGRNPISDPVAPAVVTVVDLDSGRRLRRFETTASRVPPQAHLRGDVVVLGPAIGDGLRDLTVKALDLDGQEVWRTRGRGWAGELDGTLFIHAGPSRYRVTDARDGRELGSFEQDLDGPLGCASDELLIFQYLEMLTVLDRSTFSDVWPRNPGAPDPWPPAATSVVATADALFWIDSVPDGDGTLVSHAQRTASILDRLPVLGEHRHRFGAELVPVAGHLLVLFGEAGAPPPMVVELLS